jgi:hypothetical protein
MVVFLVHSRKVIPLRFYDLVGSYVIIMQSYYGEYLRTLILLIQHINRNLDLKI